MKSDCVSLHHDTYPCNWTRVSSADRRNLSQEYCNIFSDHKNCLQYFTEIIVPILGPSQPPTQLVQGTLFQDVKQLKLQANHSPPFSAEFKNAWSYASTPAIRLYVVVLSYAQGHYTLLYLTGVVIF
jgi:hypothetical protein